MIETLDKGQGTALVQCTPRRGQSPLLFAYLARAVEVRMKDMGTGVRVLLTYLWVVAGAFTLGSLAVLFGGQPGLALVLLVLGALNAGAALAITRF